ncbi:hypothetical protein AKJ44_02800 [candidate division MSBL1 archaeon SCGC-AAA261F17]|uniref:Large ribosomal subunit protein eL30 n=3 Tax=candidate division MSBL1 TaxID=215777 RepID=A0A133V1B7_9EURY|nr:hypothetical protein AKJ42_01400 [candidate division MSBL1 archaeon SCGC-AAA261C02]KXB01203.1 hypothetical protein AKJ44_02800 [candidate division MSBL1 archaeon SCGC-AAA261F17]KXB04187.1 hypothetical protein AKJ47_00245 [candidate division MSBL1 archaeon SCGC-AAA261G05]
MDIDKELRRADRTGEVVLGSKKVLEAIKHGNAKLVLITPNCSDSTTLEINQTTELGKIPTHMYNGTSEDLGLAFGKPFLVSAAAIIDPGNSQILQLGGTISES